MIVRLCLLAAVVVAVAFAAAVHGSDRRPVRGGKGPAQGDERQQLQSSVAMWQRQHLRNYKFRLRVRCFCPERQAVTVTVRDGRPVRASGTYPRLDTVPELFEAIRRVVDDPRAGAVVIRYDAHRGFPRTASIDPMKNAIDDEMGWTVDRFQALRHG